jgi:hypothetical protein
VFQEISLVQQSEKALGRSLGLELSVAASQEVLDFLQGYDIPAATHGHDADERSAA